MAEPLYRIEIIHQEVEVFYVKADNVQEAMSIADNHDSEVAAEYMGSDVRVMRWPHAFPPVDGPIMRGAF